MLTYRIYKYRNDIRLDIYNNNSYLLAILYSKLNKRYISSYIILDTDILKFLLLNNIVSIITETRKTESSYTSCTLQLTSKALIKVL